MVLEGYTSFRFTHDGDSKTVYRRGAGPGVVIIHEVPGITPPVERFANFVVDAGFTAFLPHLFGTPGKPLSVGYALEQMVRACVSREFHVLAAGGSSPVTDWLRALCRHAHAECGGPRRRRDRHVPDRQLRALADGRRERDGAGALAAVAAVPDHASATARVSTSRTRTSRP